MKLDDNYKINFDQNNEILNSLIEKYLNDKIKNFKIGKKSFPNHNS